MQLIWCLIKERRNKSWSQNPLCRAQRHTAQFQVFGILCPSHGTERIRVVLILRQNKSSPILARPSDGVDEKLILPSPHCKTCADTGQNGIARPRKQALGTSTAPATRKPATEEPKSLGLRGTPRYPSKTHPQALPAQWWELRDRLPCPEYGSSMPA